MNEFQKYEWYKPLRLEAVNFECGYCGANVASELGYSLGLDLISSGWTSYAAIYICPSCNVPSVEIPQSGGAMLPRPLPGRSIQGLPADIESLYEEARQCIKVGSPTACSLICRKILMNAAVVEGATANQSFQQYVNWLDTSGFVPKKGKDWVDQIRKLGNEATHEIHLVTEDDAKRVLLFTEMLLRFMFELPSL